MKVTAVGMLLVWVFGSVHLWQRAAIKSSFFSVHL